MVKQLLFFCFLCVLVVSPVQGVSRLFVDEITGYTDPPVRATNVYTELLVVDEQTVENGVIADGGDQSHTVDTPGKIGFNVGALNFTAINSFEITSLGENVAFEGESVNFSSKGDFSIEGVDTSFNLGGGVTGSIGGTFSTFGTDAEVRSVFDMTFNAGNNVFFTAADKVQFSTDIMQVESDSLVSFYSQESNIFIESLVEADFTALESTSVTADSGLELGSSHGNASFDVEDQITVNAENFIYTTETNAFEIDSSLTLESQSIAGDIFMDTERSYITNPNGPITLESTGSGTVTSQTAILTSGTIESMSETITTNANDILILSVDGTTMTARADISMLATTDISFLASGGMLFAGSNVDAEAQDEFNLSAAGKAYFNSRGGDVIITAPDSFDFSSFDTFVSADTTMQLNSDDFLVSGSVIDFYSFRNIIVETPTFSVSTSEVRFESHEGTKWSSDDTIFNSDDLSVTSTGDINFNNQVFTQTALDTITYETSRESTISTLDATVRGTSAITFRALDEVVMTSDAAIDFTIADLTTFSGEDLRVVAGTSLEFSALEEITFTTDTRGEFLFEADTFQIGANDEVVFQTSNGPATFTAETISVDADDMTVTANDVVLHADSSITIQGDDTLQIQAPSTFIYSPTTISSGDIVFTGNFGVLFAAGQGVNDVLTLNAESLSDFHGNVLFQGGSISVDVEDDLDFGTVTPGLQDIEFSSGGEKDLNLISRDDIIISANAAFFSAGNIDFTQSKLDVSSGGSIIYDAKERLYLNNNADLTLTGTQAFTVSEFGGAVFNAEDELTITATANMEFNTETLFEFFAHDSILVESTQSNINFASRDHHIILPSDGVLDVDAGGDINMAAGEQFSLYFNTYSFDTTSLEFTANTISTESITDTSLDTNDDIVATTEELTIEGGSISLTAVNGVTITSQGTGDVVIGSTLPTPADPVYEDVTLIFGSDYIQNAGDEFTIIATSTEEFEQLGVSIQATSFDVDASGDMNAHAFRGVEVTAPSFASTSGATTSFTNRQGAFFALAERDGSTIRMQANDDISQIANQAKMIVQAGGNIISNSGNLIYTAGKEINMESNFNNNNANADISFISDDDMDFNGQAMTIDAGIDGERTSDITFTITGSGTFTFTNDVRMRSLGNEAATQSLEQIELNGGDASNNVKYTIEAGEIMSFYPSGSFSLIADLNGQFTSDNSIISMGSISNEYTSSVRDGALTFNAENNFSVKANGVDGDIRGEIDGPITFTVTSDIMASANGTLSVTGSFVEASSTGDMTFNALNHDQSNIRILGAALQFTTTGNPVTSEMEIIGKNTRTLAQSTIFNSPSIAFGQQNIITPRITADVEFWFVDAIGNIVINAENDLVSHSSGAVFEIVAQSVDLEAGGNMLFSANSTTSQLSLSGNTIVVNALEYIEVHAGTGDSFISTTAGDNKLISLGKNTDSGILINTDNSISVLGTNNIKQTITTSSTISSSGTGTVTGNSFTSNSQTLVFDIDNMLSFSATAAFTAKTTGKTAKIEIVAEGVNGDFEFGGNNFVVSAKDDVLIDTGSLEVESNGLTVSSKGANSGKITMDASNTVIFQVEGAITVTGQDSFNFESKGPDSNLEISAADISVQSTQRSIIYETEADEGGSLYFISEEPNASFTFSAEDWEVDIDGDFYVDTRGAFTFSSLGNFELSALGYGNIAADDAISFTAGIGDIHFEAEAGDFSTSTDGALQIISTQSNVVSNTGSLDITLRGNSTSSTFTPVIQILATNGNEFYELNGDLLVSSYNQLNIDATTTTSFEGQATTGNGVYIETTAPAGDFVTKASTNQFQAVSNLFTASGVLPETGYIKIGDPLTVGHTTTATQHRVIVTDEISMEAPTGSFFAKFGNTLSFQSTDVRIDAGRAIEFHVRGDGRVIDNNFSTGAISFYDVSGVQFQADLGGDVRVESGASNVAVDSEITQIRSDTENLYIESTGSVAIVSFTRHGYTAIDVDSTGDVLITAYDSNIDILANNIYMFGPNIASVLLWEAEGNSVIDTYIRDDIDADTSAFAVTSGSGGDIVVTTRNDLNWRGDVTFTVEAQRDIHYGYRRVHRFQWTTTATFSTNDGTGNFISDSKENGIVRFSGRLGRNIEVVGDTDAQQSRPRVVLPTLPLLFSGGRVNGRISVSQGTYCEFNRQIGFGQTNQGGLNTATYSDDVFCVCVDHVWACVYDGAISDYTYDKYNTRPVAGPGP